MKFVAFCNVLIVLGCTSIGLYSMIKGHPIYGGFCLFASFCCTMNLKTYK